WRFWLPTKRASSRAPRFRSTAASICIERQWEDMGDHMRKNFIVIVASFLALSLTQAVAATVAADTPSATAAGTTFTVPAGWSSETTGKVLVLTPPEQDLKLGLIDLEAKDSAAAAAAGWQAFHPGFKRPLRVTSPQAPYNGWEERHVFDYEVSPNE